MKREWPFFTEEEARETIEEIDRGESGTLEEMFAEVAGVSVDEWKRKTAEYAQSKKHRQDGE